MIKLLVLLILINIPLVLNSQGIPDHPELGLNGVVTWLDDTHVRVEYDWSDNSQLLDWTTTIGSTLIRENGFVTVTGGSSSYVRTMIWRQGIKCSRIIAQDAAALSSEGHHLNFYSNLTSFTGDNYLPDPGIGAVLATYKNFWTHNGVNAGDIGAPYIVVGVARNYEYNITPAGMSIKSSADNITYSYSAALTPQPDRLIALGGWGGNTRWGKITIEGEVSMPWYLDPAPPDVINIQSSGAQFAPVIEVTGSPVIEWVFDDGTTSSSSAPVKNYGSEGSRHNYLKVTPWSALKGINLGYDAADGGYGDFAMVANQKALGFQNLNLAIGLEYLCASYNPVSELDLRGLSALKFVEMYQCQYLSTIKLGSHPVLERLCVEDCNIYSLDLSGCPGLEDMRAALNNYTSINWGTVGQKIWHICIRDNPQMTDNLPALTQFPVLRELLNWNTNQTGAFICHSSVIQFIDSYDNHYTSADISGCTNLRRFNLSGSQLSSLNLGSGNNLTNVQLKDCGLTKSLVDYVLYSLDAAGRSSGLIELTGNAAPSADGLIHYNNLLNKGWTVNINAAIPVSDIFVTAEGGVTSITVDGGILQMGALVLPADAGNKSVTWSILNGTGRAAINETGLVTAIENGTVTAVAMANDGSGVSGAITISISGQLVTPDNGPSEIGKIITSSNEIKILLDDYFISWAAELYDLHGRLLLSQTAESETLIFNIPMLPPGIYVVVLSQNEHSRAVKVIKPSQ